MVWFSNWFSNCTAQDRKDLQRVVRAAERRGGKHFRFFDASLFSLEWLCLDADKLITEILKLTLVCPLQHSVRLLQSATESACWFSAVHACAPNTRVSCLGLSGDKMTAMASTKPVRLIPTSLKAAVWQHFEFHEVEGRIDKTYTVCKVSGTQLEYFGNR